MSDTTPLKLRWLHLIQMWIAWILASVLGELLYGLTLVLAFALQSSLAVITGPFAGAAIGALPQALLLSRSAVEGQRSGRALAWIATSALGGLLATGYLFYDITSPPTWSDVIRWYAPVTAIVSLLVAGAQTAALYRMVPMPRLLAYLPLTMAGWIVGWSIFMVNAVAAAEGGGLWARVGSYLWIAAPFALIGALSGVVLAPRLSNMNPERPTRAYPWVVSAVAATLVLVVVMALLVISTHPAAR